MMDGKPYYIALSVIEPIIVARGFKKTKDEYDSKAFGNGWAEFRRDHNKLIFFWDGKESQLILERTKVRQRNSDEEFYVSADPRNESAFRAGLEKFRKTLVEQMNGQLFDNPHADCQKCHS